MEQAKLTRRGAAPTIGFLVDWLEDTYQWMVLRGALEAARDRGAHLLCFTGGVLGAPDHRGGARRNGVFDLARPESVDALVILAGTIGNHVGPDRLREHCARYRPLPMCSIAVDIPGMSSVCVDNVTGMQAAIRHLARAHGMRRVGFVCGPPANAEADQRLRAYRDALGECGIAFDPMLVAPGNFQPEAGRAAARLFVKERKVQLDAIVAANDGMALGALDELERMGIRVPDQIAIIGFDDIDEVRFSSPPLTTVRQPLYEQGREAVRLVLEQLWYGTGVEKLVRPTELVLRRSCRCFGPTSDGVLSSAALAGRLGFEAALVDRRQVILAHVSRAARGAFGAAGPGWDQRLVTAFANQMRGDSPSVFLEAYDDLLRRLLQGGAELSICNDVLTALRRQMLGCLGFDPSRRAQAEDVFQEARVLTSQVMERAQAWERMQAQRRARRLGHTGGAMVGAAGIEDLSRAAAESLPGLGIQRCYVSAFEPGPGGQRATRIVLSHEPASDAAPVTTRARTPLEAQRDEGASGPKSRAVTGPYRSTESLLRGVLQGTRERAFTVAPLFFGDDDLGVVLLELGAADGAIYESLRELFSAALWAARLTSATDESRRRIAALEAELARLTEERTRIFGPDTQ